MCWILTYEHEGDPPDAVLTRNALHHLPDFWKVAGLERIASCFGLEACCSCGISSFRSSLVKRVQRSSPGSPQPLTIRQEVGRLQNSLNTSAKNTQRSPGYLNQ